MAHRSKIWVRRTLQLLKTASLQFAPQAQLLVLASIFGSAWVRDAFAAPADAGLPDTEIRLSAGDRANLEAVRERLSDVVTPEQIARLAEIDAALSPEALATFFKTDTVETQVTVEDLLSWLDEQIAGAYETSRNASVFVEGASDESITAAIESEFAGTDASQTLSETVLSASKAAGQAAVSGGGLSATAGAVVGGEALGLAPLLAPTATAVVAGVSVAGTAIAVSNSSGSSVPSSENPAPSTVNPVELSESQLRALVDGGVADSLRGFDGTRFRADANVTLTVEGSTLSDSGISLTDLSFLGVDTVVPAVSGAGLIDIDLGLTRHLSDRSVTAAGTSAQTTEQQVNAALESLVKDLPKLADAAVVTLGLNAQELAQLQATVESFLNESVTDASAGQSLLSGIRFAGIDALALSAFADSGPEPDALIVSSAFVGAIESAGLRFNDVFRSTESGEGLLRSHVVMEATVLGPDDVLGADNLRLLGVEEVRFGEQESDGRTGAFESVSEALAKLSTNLDSVTASIFTTASDRLDFDSPALLGPHVIASVRLAVDPHLLSDISAFLDGMSVQHSASDVSAGGLVAQGIDATVLNTASDLQSLIDLGVDKLVIGDVSVVDVFDLHMLDPDML